MELVRLGQVVSVRVLPKLAILLEGSLLKPNLLCSPLFSQNTFVRYASAYPSGSSLQYLQPAMLGYFLLDFAF